MSQQCEQSKTLLVYRLPEILLLKRWIHDSHRKQKANPRLQGKRFISLPRGQHVCETTTLLPESRLHFPQPEREEIQQRQPMT